MVGQPGHYSVGHKNVVLYAAGDSVTSSPCRIDPYTYVHELAHALHFQAFWHSDEWIEDRYWDALDLSRARYGLEEGCFGEMSFTGNRYWQTDRFEFFAEMVSRATLRPQAALTHGSVGIVGLEGVHFPYSACTRDERYPQTVRIDRFNPVFHGVITAFIFGGAGNAADVGLSGLEQGLIETRRENGEPSRATFARPFMEVPPPSWAVRQGGVDSVSR